MLIDQKRIFQARKSYESTLRKLVKSQNSMMEKNQSTRYVEKQIDLIMICLEYLDCYEKHEELKIPYNQEEWVIHSLNHLIKELSSISQKFKLGSSQLTFLGRRIDAFHLILEMISSSKIRNNLTTYPKK